MNSLRARHNAALQIALGHLEMQREPARRDVLGAL